VREFYGINPIYIKMRAKNNNKIEKKV